MKVAFIGLGIMGSRMAQNLLSAGHELVVHNRTHSKAGGLLGKGAVFAESPSAAVKDADVLITMLAEPASVNAVARGKHGFLNSLSPDTIWMDCSTVDPAFAREISAECKQRGLRFLETPVSGTRVHAEEGVLKFSVGGDKADLEVVRPLMEIMGNQIDPFGSMRKRLFHEIGIEPYDGMLGRAFCGKCCAGSGSGNRSRYIIRPDNR